MKQVYISVCLNDFDDDDDDVGKKIFFSVNISVECIKSFFLFKRNQ